MSQQILLTLDTSSPHLTMGLYALGNNEVTVLAESAIDNDSQRYHSSMLMPALSTLFENAGKPLQALSDLAIHIGPGSFTGIRTGLISARTLGQFLPIQTHAINAFELAIFTASTIYPEKPICIALDARRGRAYSACGIYKEGFQWVAVPSLSANEDILSAHQNTVMLASQSLSETLPFTQSLESIYATSPASRQIAMLIQSQPTLFKRPWEALIPLYLEEPNITLPKRNPAIIQSQGH